MENANNEFETAQSSPTDESGSPEADKKENKKKKTVSLKISVRVLTIIGAVILIGAILFYSKGLFIAATVNGTPIGRLTVIKELERVSGTSALDSLINKKLISDEARKKGIKISDDEISAEVKTVEDQIKAQGKTLNEELAKQGMKLEDLKKQITIQKTLEKIFADKIQITNDEVEQYIKDNNVTIPAGQEADYKKLIENQMRQDKLNKETESFVSSLRSQANIRYFVKYYIQ